jgi:hypothetical protein
LSLEVVESEVLSGAPQLPLVRKIYRDTAGRTRIDPYQVNLVLLMDPVKGVLFVLESPSNVAHRMESLKVGPSSGSPHFTFFVGPSAQEENLGKQIIDGIEYEGMRVTISKGTPEAETIERWISNDLGLIGLTRASGPDGDHTVRVQNIVRAEPDPMLFELPQEYTIRDLNSPEN